ncbi:hypothetical protein KR009_002727 [Drosophila setifemur]|nr:hypothetical protein KR009_002727 [Drosophila setifemur]
MGRSKKQVREFQAAKEAELVTNAQLDTCNDAYTSGAFGYLRFLVHLLAAAQFWYGMYYHYFRVHWPTDLMNEDELKARWGGKFKYLTFLDVILQAIYHTLALLNDLFGSNVVSAESKSALRSVRDYIFSAFAFPVAHNVCLSFWVIYIWDRELIFPSALDAIFPRQVQSWLNHVVHTNVALLAIMDMFTCFRRYPSRLAGITGNAAFILLYIIWLHIVRYYSGEWVYPILEVLPLPMRYLFLSLLVGFNVVCYLLGEFANRVVWGPEFKLLKEQKVKQG